MTANGNGELSIEQLREKYRDDAPEVQNATATLETLQGLLHKEVNARLMMSQSRIDMLQSRLAVYEHDRKELVLRFFNMLLAR